MSTAWASTQHRDLAMWTRVENFLVSFEENVEVRPHKPPPSTSHPAVPVTAAPEAPANAAGIPELPVDALPPARVAPSAAPRATANRPVDEASSVSPRELSIEDQASRLYAAAHHAHFVDRDSPTALRAWDAFLAFAPDDALAPEARYNRALTLVRLDRRADARLALEPFARGAYGHYRVREARALLDALSP
jgi:hypothetical protein